MRDRALASYRWNMQFFMPDPADPTKTADAAKAEQLYAYIKKYMIKHYRSVQDRRIYSVTYSHKGKRNSVKVGEAHPLYGELVMAIFCQEEPSGCYLICTLERLVSGDAVILAGKVFDTYSVDFE
jgi:hypothetical protein